ncbi:hypothetical protein [Arthrobacter sp. B6]|uniref:hypothetical protein n=1 Tax=Arthrobacter sp. B6 TaxID=1570137 RepID=UPI000AAE965A|nr:hypothetical protein [Arthrobacter sp. B6]
MTPSPRNGAAPAGSSSVRLFGLDDCEGISVLLTALITAIAAAVGAANNVNPSTVTNQGAQNLQTVNVVEGIILAVILFISYYCGGYVAGRMARFDGAKHGLAVWLWAVIATVIAAALAALAGSQFDNLLNATAFPGLPANQEGVTAGSVTALIIAALVTFAGAVLGGHMGMRFHGKVDQTGVDHRIGLER